MKRLVHSWLHADCETRIARTGRGLFALKHIPAGTLILIQGGHVMPIHEEPVFTSGGDFSIQISDHFVLGTKWESEMEDTDYINHSCDPNAGWQGQIFLVAMHDIPAGEEIRFDYATAVTLEGYGFACQCGTPRCRGRVTCHDWMLPELQARYQGWFQWYLQEKIDRLKAPLT